ncbi:MAG: hypothetical protein HOH04_12045 [Rhodospirillaceae bacterium]|jgi:hypothetical protein|nr:hypothetical protein [Rhodospirillaceae bacterium]
MNAITDHLHLSRYISEIDRFASDAGLHLELCRDFREFRDIRSTMTDRSPMSPIFDPSITDVGPGNGFWLKGTDGDGKLVHLQATRRSDLIDISLADHLFELRRLYRLPGLDMETDVQRSSMSAPALQRISGSVCYHGEIWLDESLRGKGLSAVLPRLLLALVLVKWAPDFVFGFVPTKLAYRGVQAQYGYMHVEPGGILGQKSTEDAPINKWLVWLSRQDLMHLMRFAPGLEY